MILVSDKLIECRNIMTKTINVINEDKIFETCTIEIEIYNKKYIVAGFYRTPSENIEMFLEKFNRFFNRDL